jgi:hypothetical protein
VPETGTTVRLKEGKRRVQDGHCRSRNTSCRSIQVR